VRPVPIDPAGRAGPTRGQAAGPKWRRTSQGLYVPGSVDGDVPEQRVLEQSMRLPPGGAVTGWGSLRPHGANFFDGREADGFTRMPVPLVIGQGRNIRGDELVSISREEVAPEEIVIRHGIPCTCVLRALWDEMRRVEDPREAVVAMDMAAAAWLASIRQMLAYALARTRWRRARQVMWALQLASEDSRSPNETRMRLAWEIDAGFPAPLVNQHVWDLNGRLLGIADILDPVAGVVGEFDGADHRTARRHSKDVGREGRFRDEKLEFFRVTGPDLLDKQLVVDRMRSTRRRALWLPEHQRSWTITPPPGWEVEQSLDAYLEHRDWLRSLNEQREREAGLRTVIEGRAG
jgi:hypothetical protein